MVSWGTQDIITALLTLELFHKEPEAEMRYNALGQPLGQLVSTLNNSEVCEKPKDLEHHLGGGSGRHAVQ